MRRRRLRRRRLRRPRLCRDIRGSRRKHVTGPLLRWPSTSRCLRICRQSSRMAQGRHVSHAGDPPCRPRLCARIAPHAARWGYRSRFGARSSRPRVPPSGEPALRPRAHRLHQEGAKEQGGGEEEPNGGDATQSRALAGGAAAPRQKSRASSSIRPMSGGRRSSSRRFLRGIPILRRGTVRRVDSRGAAPLEGLRQGLAAGWSSDREGLQHRAGHPLPWPLCPSCEWRRTPQGMPGEATGGGMEQPTLRQPATPPRAASSLEFVRWAAASSSLGPAALTFGRPRPRCRPRPSWEDVAAVPVGKDAGTAHGAR